MKTLSLLTLLLIWLVVGCSANDAQQLFETAVFEEQQNNKEHARQLYEEILKKHPNSEYARQAEQRLRQLKP
jgi:TolA-binding protein